LTGGRGRQLIRVHPLRDRVAAHLLHPQLVCLGNALLTFAVFQRYEGCLRAGKTAQARLDSPDFVEFLQFVSFWHFDMDRKAARVLPCFIWVARCGLGSSSAPQQNEDFDMKKFAMVAVALLVAVSVSACGTMGKGKGKGKAPAVVVTKG